MISYNYTNNLYKVALKYILTDLINLTNPVFYGGDLSLVLLDDEYVPSDDHEKLSDIESHAILCPYLSEVLLFFIYNTRLELLSETNKYLFTFDPVIIDAVGGDVEAMYYAIANTNSGFYNSLNSPLLCYGLLSDAGGSVTIPHGEALTFTPNETFGFFQIN